MPINNLPQTMIILQELRTVLKVKNYTSEVNRYKNAWKDYHQNSQKQWNKVSLMKPKKMGPIRKQKKCLQLNDMDMQQRLQIFVFKTIRAF